MIRWVSLPPPVRFVTTSVVCILSREVAKRLHGQLVTGQLSNAATPGCSEQRLEAAHIAAAAVTTVARSCCKVERKFNLFLTSALPNALPGSCVELMILLAPQRRVIVNVSRAVCTCPAQGIFFCVALLDNSIVYVCACLRFVCETKRDAALIMPKDRDFEGGGA